MAIGGAVGVYPPEMDDEELTLMTIEEVAEMLKVDRSSVSRMIRRGELKAVRWGKTVRVLRSDLVEFVYHNRNC